MSLIRDSIKCLILDAPFSDSYNMVKNIIVNHAGFGNMMAAIILYFFRSSIRSSCNYDVLGANKPLLKTQMIKTPTIFLIGEDDDLIN